MKSSWSRLCFCEGTETSREASVNPYPKAGQCSFGMVTRHTLRGELVLQGYSCLHSISFSIVLFHVDSLLLGLPSIVPRYHPHIFSLQILNPKTLSPKPCVVRSAFVSRSSRRQSSLQFTLAAPHHATQAPHDCRALAWRVSEI